MEKIIIDEINEDLNQRITIIKKDGELKAICSYDKNESDYHLYYLKEYLDEYHRDDELLQGWKKMIKLPNDPITSAIIYRLVVDHNEIVVTEITKDNSDDKKSIIYLPEAIESQQLAKFKDIEEYIKKNSSLIIIKDFYIENGCPRARINDYIEKDNFYKIHDYLKVEEKKL